MFKKRKLISIMLAISMMLTLFPFAAFAEEGGHRLQRRNKRKKHRLNRQRLLQR